MKKELSKELSLFFTNNFPKNYFKTTKNYTVTLGIGGNVGNVKKRFNLLLNMLKNNSRIQLVKTSPLLKNPPFGFIKQDDFLNAIIKVNTRLSPSEVLKLCWHYENRLGRIRSFKDAPRTLDIDILFIEKNKRQLKIKSKNLIVPHIGYKERPSVLIPLKYL